MAKLVKKSLLLGSILLVVLLAFFVVSAKEPYRSTIAFWTMSGEYPAGKGAVEAYIDSVQEENAYTKLIIGDSVCNQLFNDLQEYNDEYCIVGNNRGLTMAGEYLLFDEFLKSHEVVTDVYVIVGLDALMSEIDITYGYQYVVVPFSRIGALANLEDETLEQMSDTFGAWALQPMVAEVIGDSSVGRKLYLNHLKQQAAEKKETEDAVTDSAEYTLSDTAITYLEKMYQVCQEHGISLHLLPTPLSDNGYRHKQAQSLEEEFKRIGFDKYFPEFFSMIPYYPEEMFSDGVHFGGEYDSQEVFNDMIQKHYLDAGYVEGLSLDFNTN